MSAVAVRERPILFSGPMVRAILEGRKTQTRRPLKPQPTMIGSLALWHGCSFFDRGKQPPAAVFERCPYGAPGNRLWVRETWAWPGEEQFIYRACEKTATFVERERRDPNGVHIRWRSPIFMPRAACRIVLEVVSVRADRLQEMTPIDALQEGVFMDGAYSTEPGLPYPIATFKHGWDALYAKAPELQWGANPWVWVVQFKRVGGA